MKGIDENKNKNMYDTPSKEAGSECHRVDFSLAKGTGAGVQGVFRG